MYVYYHYRIIIIILSGTSKYWSYWKWKPADNGYLLSAVLDVLDWFNQNVERLIMKPDKPSKWQHFLGDLMQLSTAKPLNRLRSRAALHSNAQKRSQAILHVLYSIKYSKIETKTQTESLKAINSHAELKRILWFNYTSNRFIGQSSKQTKSCGFKFCQ